MKNKITKGIIGFGFLIIMVFTLIINSNKLEQNDVTLENIVALNQAQAEDPLEVDCIPMNTICVIVSVNGEPVAFFLGLRS